MWEPQRKHFIERHDFYVAQTKARVLSQFSDIDGEATRYADEAFEAVASSPYEGVEIDMGSAAEAAHDAGIERYAQLADLQNQTTQGALAGVFHQWEKELRKFLEQEFRHHIKEPGKVAWEELRTVEAVFSVLKDFGWDCKTEPSYEKIDACRMIVNVYKHGKGSSFRELMNKYPQYLDRTGVGEDTLFLESLGHEALAITEDTFDEMAAALRDFWTKIPERLYYTIPLKP